MKTLLTRRFDLAGSEISRIIRMLMFNMIPVGNLGGGEGYQSSRACILHVWDDDLLASDQTGASPCLA
jgi:hypothetical protein